MFWNSVVSALRIMTYWQTQLAGLGYLIFLFIPVLALIYILKGKPSHNLCFRCIGLILFPVLQVVAVTAFILIISPIMLGQADEVSWSLPWRIVSMNPKVSSGLLVCLMLVSVSTAFIPYLGRIHSFRTLILGCVSLVFVQLLLASFNQTVDMELSYMVPGYWFIAGISILSGILSKFDHYISRVTKAALGNKFEIREGIGELIISPVVSLVGFIPVFIYGAWLA